MFPYTQVVHESERKARILDEAYDRLDRSERFARCGGMDWCLNQPLPQPLPLPTQVSNEEFSAWLRSIKYDRWDTED